MNEPAEKGIVDTHEFWFGMAGAVLFITIVICSVGLHYTGHTQVAPTSIYDTLGQLFLFRVVVTMTGCVCSAWLVIVGASKLPAPKKTP